MSVTFNSIADGLWSAASTWWLPTNVVSVVTSTQTITVAGDVTASFQAGGGVLFAGGVNAGIRVVIDTIVFNLTNTVIVYLSTMEPIVDSGASGTVTPGIPATGDDVTVDQVVTVDVVAAGINSLTITGTALADPDLGSDPFTNLSSNSVAITLTGGNLNGLTTEVNVNLSGTCEFNNTNLIEVDNGIQIVFAPGAQLTWDGVYNAPDGDLHIGDGLLIGTDLILHQCDSVFLDGGSITGNVTFVGFVNVVDESGGMTAPTFGEAGGVFTISSSSTLDIHDFPTAVLGGTWVVFGTVIQPASVTGTATINLMKSSSQWFLDDNVTIQWGGQVPSGAFSSFFHIGL